MHKITTKTIFTTLLLTLFVSGCGLFSSGPSAVVKQLMRDAERGNIDGMVNIWSQKAADEMGADYLRESAQKFALVIKSARDRGENLQIEKLRETVQGERARVFYLYRDEKANDSFGMGFAMVKEDGKWKLYRAIDIGEEGEPFDSSFAPKKSPAADSSPAPDSSPTDIIIAPPPPPDNSNRKNATNSNSPAPASNGEPISGGVLNSSATSLPKPAYPPAAKAAKAGGTVVVQVLVDESGNVMTANAVSGHPLLRSAAEQAARIAHFRPTVLSGKRVKVKGTVTYSFSPE
jgi:TonB family protein